MKPFDRVIAIGQLFMLLLWEATALYFDWSALAVLIVWFVGIWTFNILVATGVRTFFKLITPQTTVQHVGSAPEIEITEEDIGG